ncbi:MAG: hypothetical protein ACLR4Z_01610 [Butyricicoccaceae bacterium]
MIIAGATPLIRVPLILKSSLRSHEVGAYLVDMAHIAGLVAAGCIRARFRMRTS